MRRVIVYKGLRSTSTLGNIVRENIKGSMSSLKKYILHDTFLGIHYYDYRNTLVVSEQWINHDGINSTSNEIYQSKVITKDNQSTRNLQYYTKQVKPMSSFKIKRL